MKADLITLTLNDQDVPVLAFTHHEAEPVLEQKLLGMFIRQVARQGIELHKVRQYPDNDGKLHWVYEIRPLQPESDESE